MITIDSEFSILIVLILILDFGVTSHNVIDQSMIIHFEVKPAKSSGFYIDSNVY
jgi:hypothetical protein